MFKVMERVVGYIGSVVAAGVRVTESRLIYFKQTSRLFRNNPCVRNIRLKFDID